VVLAQAADGAGPPPDHRVLVDLLERKELLELPGEDRRPAGPEPVGRRHRDRAGVELVQPAPHLGELLGHTRGQRGRVSREPGGERLAGQGVLHHRDDRPPQHLRPGRGDHPHRQVDRGGGRRPGGMGEALGDVQAVARGQLGLDQPLPRVAVGVVHLPSLVSVHLQHEHVVLVVVDPEPA
jgi:hypothetical protein